MGIEVTARRLHLVVGDVLGGLDRLALDRAVAEHGDDGRRRRRKGDDLHGADGEGLGLRPDDDGGVVRQPGEQIGRAMEHLLEPPVGGGEEVADGRTGVLVEQPGGGEMVDEEAVTLVGGDPPCRGVRLDEVALLFEHGHLVAHGGRGHADLGRVGDVGRAHREGGGDVLLHHRTQDRRLPLVQHGAEAGYRRRTVRWHSFGSSARLARAVALAESGRRPNDLPAPGRLAMPVDSITFTMDVRHGTSPDVAQRSPS